MDLSEAVHSINGGVVCLISALAVYDLTEEIPRQHWIGILHGTSARSGRQIKIVSFRDIDLGKIEIELEGARIPIFDRERTIVNAFRLSKGEFFDELAAIIGRNRCIGRNEMFCLSTI